MSNPKIRINTFLARAGLGSRRSVERLIKDGKISLNGVVISDFTSRVDPSKDLVLCDGKVVELQPHVYLMLNKPRGYACTKRDPHASKTIYDLLPEKLQHLVYAGRLDVDSEGLLLLSNDGDWLDGLVHPKYEVCKIYQIKVAGKVSEQTIQNAIRGIQSRGDLLRINSGKILHLENQSTFLEVVLQQGRNREIRRIFGALHHEVLRLQRIGVGNLRLKDLKEGEWRELSDKEVEVLSSAFVPIQKNKALMSVKEAHKKFYPREKG